MAKNFQEKRRSERGNALIYVLVAIALFAALSFVLGRQSDTSEVSSIQEERAEITASQIMSYASQAKQAVDQMLFTGAQISDLDFTLPSDASFNTAPRIYKVFHPDGGGLNRAAIPAAAIGPTTSAPPSGWYLGSFNNVEWTPTTATDIILVAYNITQVVCERINEKITGTTAIPQMADSIKETMIDDATTGYGAGTNLNLTTDAPGDICPDCHNLVSLCVQNQAGDTYGFYSVLLDR